MCRIVDDLCGGQHPLALCLFRCKALQRFAARLLEAGSLGHLLTQYCPCFLKGSPGIEDELAALLPNGSL